MIRLLRWLAGWLRRRHPTREERIERARREWAEMWERFEGSDDP